MAVIGTPVTTTTTTSTGDVTIYETFQKNGVYFDPTSVVLSDTTGTYGVKRDDTDAVVVAAGTAFTKTATGKYEYTFTPSVGGLTYTYVTKWVHEGETFHDSERVTDRAGSSLASQRSTSKWLTWFANQALPRTLATPQAGQEQIIETAIRFWNTHSAYKLSTMVDTPAQGGRVQLNSQFKNVVQAYPSQQASTILNHHPLWTLVGVEILDNVTGDLILMSEAYKNYQIYTGTDFRWMWVKSDDPDTGGYLYVRNPPNNSSKLLVVGTKRITSTEDVIIEPVLEWLLRYAWALLKKHEGRALRAAETAGIKTDGSDWYSEGEEERKQLEEELSRNGRWVAFARRC